MANTFPATQRDWFLRVLQLAWPIILSGLSVPLVGLVDTAVMGRLPEPHYMAAVAVGAVIFSSVFWVFGFLRMGTTGFVAQAAGRSDQYEVSLAVWRALLVAVFLGLLVILLQKPVGIVAFWLMGAAEDVTASAQTYFYIRVWSAPATFVNYVILGCMIGLQRMRSALLVQLLLNVSNMILDIVFVLVLGMDVAGVALASLLSELVALVLGLWLLRNTIFSVLRSSGFEWFGFSQRLLRAETLFRLLQVNADLFMRTMLLTGGFFFFTAQGAQFGTVTLAANAILMNMFSLMAYGLDGFAHAAEALVGGAYGAGNRRVFRQVVWSSTVMAGLTAILISVLCVVFGPRLIGMLTDIDAVIQAANTYLIWLAVLPLLAVWSFQLDGIFVGTMHTRAMRNTVAAALLVYVLLVLLLVPIWGNHALWGCMLLFLSLRGVFLGLLYPGVVKSIAA